MECVISACKWRVKPSAGKHETKPSNIGSSLRRDKGRAGFSNKPSQTLPPPLGFCWCHGNFKEDWKQGEGNRICFVFPATKWFGRQPWKMKQTCTGGGEAASRQPLAASYLLTPGPSAAQLEPMAGTNQSHAAMQTASVMRLLLCSMCLLQGFFPLQKDHFASRVHSSQITVAMTSKPQHPEALKIPAFRFGFAFYSRY